MNVVIQYFAAARELCQCSEETLCLADDRPETVGSVFALACAKHPRLQSYQSRMTLALNDQVCGPEQPVRAGDRVAVLPPVAGGGPLRCSIVSTPLSVDAALAAVQHAGAGGIAVFIGVVRDHADGKAVARLDYEAHETMALTAMQGVLSEVEREVPSCRLWAQHRVGRLSIGDAAIVVAASAPHRAEAFEACRAVIDRIKERVPIWKKEWEPGGGAEWVNLGAPGDEHSS